MACQVTERYDPSEYWERLHARDGLDAVGQSGMPANFNRWLYLVTARRLDEFVRGHDLRPNNALDVGSGTGYWVAWWADHGVRNVDGCDLVPVAVDRLRDRFPGKFEVLDIGTAAPSGTYDMVSVLNVLLHITDDRRFRSALRNLAEAVRPGGYLLMVEPIQTGNGYRATYATGASSLARPASDYMEPLIDAGLEFVALEGATAIGADPIEASNRAAFASWRTAWRIAKLPPKLWPASGAISGWLVWKLDPMLLRIGFAPSSKILLMKKLE
jgi:SAM-dependent methyltransferase